PWRPSEKASLAPSQFALASAGRTPDQQERSDGAQADLAPASPHLRGNGRRSTPGSSPADHARQWRALFHLSPRRNASGRLQPAPGVGLTPPPSAAPESPAAC